MAQELNGKRIAVLATHGVEQIELTDPRKALEEAGAQVEVIAPEPGEIKGWDRRQWGDPIPVDRGLDEANPADYDGLLLPGGVMNPDHLRMDERAVAFTRSFFEQGKPVASICHGPWTLINAGVARGRRMTSYPSLRADLENAGATWVDEQVVVDNGLVTSRRPDDLPAFNAKMIEEFAEGKHEGMARSA